MVHSLDSFNFRVFIMCDIMRTAVTELSRIFKVTPPAIFKCINERRNVSYYSYRIGPYNNG